MSVVGCHSLQDISIQLDWPSETDPLKNNFQRDREGYDGSETTYEKFSEENPNLRGPKLHFLVFLKNNFTNNDNGAWVPAELGSPSQKL